MTVLPCSSSSSSLLFLLAVLLCLCPTALSQTTFSFCHLVTTNGELSYSTWAAVMVGTFTATALSSSGGESVYNVTAVSGYRNVSSASLTGAVASTAQLVGLSFGANALGVADSQLSYPTETTYTDGSGVTILTSAAQSDISGCMATTQYNVYSDTQQLCGLLSSTQVAQTVATTSFAQLTVVPGSAPPPCTVPAKPTTAPTYNASSAVQVFSFCYTTYSTAVVPGLTVWASVTSGSLTAAQSTNNGVFLVTALTGTRAVSALSGNGSLASTVSISALESAATCFGGCDNALYYSGSGSASTDALGLSFLLAGAQTDPSGCSGQNITVHGTSSVCDAGVSSSPTNSLVISTAAQSCAVPTTVATVYPGSAGSCNVGSTLLSSLGAADLSYFDCVSGQTVYLRLCQAVSNPACVAAFGTNSMVCLAVTQYSVFNAAALNAATAAGALSFAYANRVDLTAGVVFNTSSGAACGALSGVTRRVSGVITCGCANALVGWVELSPCNYVAQLTSPAACPSTPPACTPVQQYSFALCSTLSATAPATTSSWTAVTSATLTAVASQCGGSGVYNVQSISGWRATSNNYGGTASNSSITGLSTLGDADNTIRYPAGAGQTYSTYTDTNGLSFTTAVVQSDGVCTSDNTFNIYADTAFICGLNGATQGQSATLTGASQTTTVALLTNSLAPQCAPPSVSGAAPAVRPASLALTVVVLLCVGAMLLSL